MNSPLVSVLIPCFNAAATIRQTLESALAQTWPNVEIILVDDGSSDGTAEIAKAMECERLRVVLQENQGACAARNRGMELAKGEFVQFLDADDLLSPTKIADQVNRLSSLSSDYVAYGPWDYVDASGKVVGAGLKSGQDFSPGLGFLVSSLTAGYFVPPHAWLVPRRVLERAGPWDARLVQNQDGEYFSRVLENAAGAAWVDTAGSYYRAHRSGSISQRRDEAAERSLLLAAELIEGRLVSSGMGDGAKLAGAVYLRALYRLEKRTETRAKLWKAAVARGLPNRRIQLGGKWFQRLYRLFGWRLAFEARRAKLAFFSWTGVSYRR